MYRNDKNKTDSNNFSIIINNILYYIWYDPKQTLEIILIDTFLRYKKQDWTFNFVLFFFFPGILSFFHLAVQLFASAGFSWTSVPEGVFN